MKRLLVVVLVFLTLGISRGQGGTVTASVPPCTSMYVRTDVSLPGVSLYGTDYRVLPGERVCFRGEVDAPLGYSQGESFLYLFRVEVGGISGWVPEVWLTTSRPQVWPQARVAAEWPQVEQEGSVSWVQRWTDGSYVSWTMETAPRSDTTATSVVREYPQREADGSVSWVQEWGDGSFTWRTIEEAPRRSTGQSPLPQGRQWVEVAYIVDGDTFEVVIDGNSYRVRLFGVDTPEFGQRCYNEAREAARRLLQRGTYLESDVRDRDSYGRLLRYAFDIEGASIDAALVAQGYGYAWRRDGKYRDWIVSIEAEAKENRVGCLWNN